jgi:transposase InsO family protein
MARSSAIILTDLDPTSSAASTTPLLQSRRGPFAPKLEPRVFDLVVSHLLTAAVTAVIVYRVCRTGADRPALPTPAKLVQVCHALAKRRWTQRCRAAAKACTKSRGRPPVPDVLVQHILQIKRENPTYGKARIAAILTKSLGVPVAPNTVQAVLRRHPPPRSPETPPSKQWVAFLHAVIGRSASMDFKVVNDTSGRQIYILSILHHARRELLVCNATYSPTSAWIAQQLREAFPFDTAPRYMILDNDPHFTNAVGRILPSMGVIPKLIKPSVPKMNPFVERFNRTLTEELLDRLPILSDMQMIRLLREYRVYYNTARPHTANAGEPPIFTRPPANDTGIIPARIKPVAWLGGLHHSDKAAA